MKGIVLAGGSGTRLYPVTKAISKQLLPIYDKPMVYYPISVLMLAGIRDILIISTPEDISKFENLLSDGAQFGVNFSYKIQPSPDGLAQAFILGEEFIGNDSTALVLGDNIFYGQSFSKTLQNAVNRVEASGGATVFGYRVRDPQRFGVVEFDENGKALSIEEKPKNPKSVEYAKNLKPSSRGELEITDLNNIYLKNNKLHVELLGRGFAWLDTGTHESLLQAGQYVQTVENNQGIKIACLEEIAYNMGFLKKEDIEKISSQYKNNEYYGYIKSLIK